MPEPDHVVYGIKVERVRKGLLSFVDLMGEFLSPARRSIYERILDAIPEMTDLRGRKRLTEGGNLTLIHEDAHLGNIWDERPCIHHPFWVGIRNGDGRSRNRSSNTITAPWLRQGWPVTRGRTAGTTTACPRSG